jgi:hypothetical protein
VPAEAPRVGQAGHPGGQGQISQPQDRIVLRAALLPRLDLGLGRYPDQRVVERPQVAIDDDAMTARVPELDLGPDRRGVSGG